MFANLASAPLPTPGNDRLGLAAQSLVLQYTACRPSLPTIRTRPAWSVLQVA